jgi:hypothetical protein
MAELFDIPIEQISTNPVGSPYNPFQVDPAAASQSFINAMSSPELQNAILGAERTFRPQYTDINLSELQRYMLGTKDQPGLVGTLGQVTPEIAKIQAGADTAARQAAISDITNLSEPTLAALMRANPEYFAQLNQAKLMGGPTDFFKDYEKALANRAILGDVQVTPASAALVQNVAPVSLSGYTAAQGTAPMLGAAPTAQASLLGAAPTIGAQGYSAEGYGAQGYTSQGYDAARAARVADIASRDVTQGALGQQLYGQAMQAAPTAASETFRRRAAEMAISTGQLSPEELRASQQATREAFAARGLEMSNQAIAAEAMSRSDAVRQRQAQDIQQAAALNQAYLADLNASRGFATGVYGQDLGMQQANQAAALQAAQANQAAGLQLSLADQAALNQAAQFGAMSANEAARFGAMSANEAAQFGAAARNQAAQFGAGAQNVAAQANADMMARYAMANQAAQNQFGLANVERAADFLTRNQAVGAEFGLANLGAQNTAAQFGAEAANRGALANLDVASRNALANQDAINRMALAGQDLTSNIALANRAFTASRQDQGAADLARLGSLRMDELGANRANTVNLANAYNQAFNPMRDVLGTKSTASEGAAALSGMGADVMGRFMGPQMFSPDAGINLALANQSNLANYRASIEGANTAAAGAKSGATTGAVANVASAAILAWAF